MNNSIKPSFKVFFYLYSGVQAISFLIFFVPAIILALAVEDSTVTTIAAVVALGSVVVYAINVLNRYIQFQKEEYILQEERIIVNSGSIFTSNKIELNIKNITNVERIYPFWERPFGTGRLKIESAGSSSTEVYLESIDQINTVTDKVIKLMEKNGFSLSMEQPKVQKNPSLLGVALEALGLIFSSCAVLFWISLEFWGESEAGIEETTNTISSLFSSPIFWVIAAIALILFMIYVGIRFMDWKERVYTVYEDVVTFHEGFLTKHYAFIPVQNLSDAAVEQDLIRRIFGIYNIIISTRGTGNRITFSNIPDGNEVEAEIDNLIASHSAPRRSIKNTEGAAEKTESHRAAKGEEIPVKDTSQRDQTEFRRREFTDFTGKYKISGKYLVFGPILSLVLTLLIVIVAGVFAALVGAFQIFLTALLFIGFFIIVGIFTGFIGALLQYFAVTYEVRENTVYERYALFSKYTKEFTLDKITSVKLSRTILDRVIGTCSIQFLSIGSGENINFTHIDYSPELYENVLDKLDLVTNKENTRFATDLEFSITNWIAKNLVALVLITPTILIGLAIMAITGVEFFGLSLLIVGLLLLITLVALVYYYFYYRTISLHATKKFIGFKGGLLTLVQHYGYYDYVKSDTVRKYVFGDAGDLTFDIAGETIDQQRTQQQQRQSYGTNNAKVFGNFNTIKFAYVANAQTTMKCIEEIMTAGRVLDTAKEADKQLHTELFKPVVSTKPSIAHEATLTVISYVILFPLIVFLPFRIWQYLVTDYKLTELAIRHEHGIFYRTTKTVLMQQLDHIELNRGLTNQIFGTGKIAVNTEGSNTVELYINNIEDYESFYDELQKRYR